MSNNQLEEQMSTTTIMMPAAFQGAIQSMCEDAIGQAIKALSEKYSFDADEARRELKLGKIQVKAAAASKGSSKKDSAEKPKSKRGKTGYLLYTGELRAEVKAEMEAELADGEKLKPQDVVTKLAARWKELSDEEKAEWNQKAKDANSESETSDTESAPPAEKPKKETKKAVEKPKKETKKAVEKKAEDAEAKPKKKNGYLVFSKEMRADVKEALEAELEEGEKLKPQAIIQELAAQWKALSDEEKAEWTAKANTPSSDADSVRF